MKSRSVLSLLVLASSLLLAAANVSAQRLGGADRPDRGRGPELWFSPGDDLEVSGVVTHPDYPTLFDEPSRWPTGLARVDVMQLRAPYIARKPTESAGYAAFLKAHNIAIAAVMQVMPADTCGQGVEGMMSRKGIDFYPRAIKKAGIDLDWVLMDEPLYFGHDYTGKNACQYSIDEVAKGVAESEAVIRSYHPRARFVLATPLSIPGGPEELAQFLDALKADAHEYPASVRLDVQWNKEWKSAVAPMVRVLRQRGISWGVILNATGGIKTDHDWIASAESNAQAFLQTTPSRPDHIAIQTWTPNPVRITPESDPDTMTAYLKWFVERFGRGTTGGGDQRH